MNRSRAPLPLLALAPLVCFGPLVACSDGGDPNKEALTPNTGNVSMANADATSGTRLGGTGTR
jgi:hypothetical protein